MRAKRQKEGFHGTPLNPLLPTVCEPKSSVRISPSFGDEADKVYIQDTFSTLFLPPPSFRYVLRTAVDCDILQHCCG